MDCAECVRRVQKALSDVPGVKKADVFLTSEKAVLQLEQPDFDMEKAQKAVADAGYAISGDDDNGSREWPTADLSRQAGRFTALIFVTVLFVIIAGEWLGLFDDLADRVPLIIGLLLVIAAGFPIFRNVVRATWRREIISHTLMTLGVVAALFVGEWVTALIVVFFMRVGDYIERYTTEQARQAVKSLSSLTPQTARVVWEGVEAEVPIASISIGDLVVIRPGERIPVDGEVVVGHAAVDQSAITGESMPVDVGPGAHVYAATIAHGGSIQVNSVHIGRESTFGRIIKMVEEAEANRADVQRFADKFSTYFLPIVLLIALLTFIIRRDPMAVAAVLVVACSCAIALATPIAMLASIGTGAKKGLMIKGGKYVELLDKADILLIDKTGTLTLGRPRVTDIVAFNGLKESQLLSMAASVEKYSEHPIARAVQAETRRRGLNLEEPAHFEAIPGFGVKAEVGGMKVRIGNERMIDSNGIKQSVDLKEQGKTLMFIEVDGKVAGLLALADKLRDEVPDALAEVRELGVFRIELLSGDNEQATAAIANKLKLPYQANLLPVDKINIVKSYQQQGHRVVMIGDGVNDAPALAQADVGVAMGAAGTDVALEAAHVALLRDDWRLVPDLFRISHRTMRVVRMNLGFTALYNVIGLTLAAFGILPPVLAAAAQSLPDLGIMANSSRLLRD